MEEYLDLMVREAKMAQLMSLVDKMGRMVDIDSLLSQRENKSKSI
jgi:hypothetical protein